jgi:uncharacterized protein
MQPFSGPNGKGLRMSVVRYLMEADMNSQGFSRLLSPWREMSSGAGGLVAVKLHPGEEGNRSFVKPHMVKMVMEALDLPRGKTFLTDTTVLYGGRRMNAPDYMTLADEHGFGMPEFPPFIVADGLNGTDEIRIPLPECCETREARLAGALRGTSAAVMISHFKGHLLAGFGGAVKHLGMGWASRGGKLYQHSSVMPAVRHDRCTGCSGCIGSCSSGAISMEGPFARIRHDRCTGCGECLHVCPVKAIRISWNQESQVFMRRMTEHALGAALAVNIPVYVNFLLDISPDCDCMKNEGPPLVKDIGVLASNDPVAIDQASLDLVTAAEPTEGNARAGADKFKAIRPDRNGELQLEIGESIGLGTRSYQLIQVSE